MGAVDVQRQALNVFRMELLGAKVVSVTSGNRTLKDAVNETLRYWVATVEDTNYVMGSVLGPHPFPEIVRDFQSVWLEWDTAATIRKRGGQLPTTVVACVGGGSNAMGMNFTLYRRSDRSFDWRVGSSWRRILLSTRPWRKAVSVFYMVPNASAARRWWASDRTLPLISAVWLSRGRSRILTWRRLSERVAVPMKKPLTPFYLLSPNRRHYSCFESAHAVAYAPKLAPIMTPEERLVICLSGRGTKMFNKSKTGKEQRNDQQNIDDETKGAPKTRQATICPYAGANGLERLPAESNCWRHGAAAIEIGVLRPSRRWAVIRSWNAGISQWDHF